VDVVELTAGLYFLRFGVGHAYLCQDSDGLTLIDTGVPGSAPLIARAIQAIGQEPDSLRRLVLTHFHGDHVGSAAEIAAWGTVEVYAHQADSAFIRGTDTGPAANLEAWEKPIFDRVQTQLPTAPIAPVRVDQELTDGDIIEFGGGAVVVAAPGHTPGSLACYLPGPRVLLTGDAIARGSDGAVMLGVFNTDRAQAISSFHRLAALDAEIACFGHGEPLTADAATELRAVGQQLPGHPDPAAPRIVP
jgi:glyoxylase-like metal-dependent hydrolase (beta-lactamase superfamily II)